jgi:hypothetical protein
LLIGRGKFHGSVSLSWLPVEVPNPGKSPRTRKETDVSF